MSSKLKRINKLKLITFWVICGLIALFFKFSMVTPTYAYYLGNDNNIYSNNIYNYSGDLSSGGVTKVLEGSTILLNGVTNATENVANYEISYIESGTYTLSNKILSGTGDSMRLVVHPSNWAWQVTLFLGNEQSETEFTTNGETLTFSFYQDSNRSYNNLKIGVMLNVGNEPLTYEPSGKWWNESAYETQKYLASLININQLFNGATVELDGTGEGVLASGVMSLDNNNNVTLSYDNLPYVIRNYISTHSSDSFEINIKLTKQTNASLYLNSNYNTISCNVFYDYNGGYPLNDNYYRQFNASKNTNNYLINPTFNYNYIVLSYINTTNNNFNISISNDNYFYRDGYNDGYTNGYNDGTGDGYDNGYNVGKVDGYTNGYTEGEQTDFASSGFKTLITTILSYPVNMVKESLNFEFMGIHIASIVLFLISLGIVAFVIKRFKD